MDNIINDPDSDLEYLYTTSKKSRSYTPRTNRPLAQTPGAIAKREERRRARERESSYQGSITSEEAATTTSESTILTMGYSKKGAARKKRAAKSATPKANTGNNKVKKVRFDDVDDDCKNEDLEDANGDDITSNRSYEYDEKPNAPIEEAESIELAIDPKAMRKEVLDSLTPFELADMLMKKGRAFTIEFLHSVKKQGSLVTDLVYELGEKYAEEEPIESYKEKDDGMGPALDYVAPPEGRVKFDFKGASEITAKMLMKAFDDTLEYHRGGRCYSDTKDMHNNKTVQLAREKLAADQAAAIERERAFVEDSWAQPITGFRGYFGVRRAFDYILVKIGGPKVAWGSPEAWFKATIQVVHTDLAFCMLLFEPDTHRFLATMRGAMEQAERDAMHTWMQEKDIKLYAEWMGLNAAVVEAPFQDVFKPISIFD